jgi:hypothetical protein
VRVLLQHDPVPPSALGRGERALGALDEELGGGEVREDGDAAAPGGGEAGTGRALGQPREALAQVVQDRAGRGPVGVREDDPDLVSAMAPDDVGAAQALLEEDRQSAQRAARASSASSCCFRLAWLSSEVRLS